MAVAPFLLGGCLLLMMTNCVLTSAFNSSCPPLCDCSSSSVMCHASYYLSWPEFLQSLPVHAEALTISGGNLYFQPKEMQSTFHSSLRKLHLVQTQVAKWDPSVFQMTPNLTSLHISHSHFTHHHNVSFANLTNLQNLVAADCNITSLKEDAFDGLTNLQVLDLSGNDLQDISADLFHDQANIQSIDVGFNSIQYIDPFIVANLTSLIYLNVQYNQIQWLASEFLDSIPDHVTVNIDGNPWGCYCGINPLIEALQSNPGVFFSLANLQCHSPPPLQSVALTVLSPNQTICQPPVFDFVPDNNTVIHHMYDAVLHCNATGIPAPNIYWITPRGVVAHPNAKEWLTEHHTEAKVKISFAGKPSFFKAEIEAAENGDLYFRQFRFYFAGTYTCRAENPGGFQEHSVEVTITKGHFNHIVIVSIVYGFVISMSMFVVGIIVGAIRWVAERWCCKSDLDSLPSAVYVEDDWMEETAPGTEPFYPWHMPWMWSPSFSREDSPKKCVTPAEGHLEEEDGDKEIPGSSSHILEQLEDVRALLRHGMKRSMVKLRTGAAQVRETGTRKLLYVRESSTARLQTIRESSSRRLHNIRSSSSQYISNIRETGSRRMRFIRSSTGLYVSRVRSGVNIGMESVRSNIQSIREFCGPGGDIAHTISTVSVTTDVDSHETSQVVKTVTYL